MLNILWNNWVDLIKPGSYIDNFYDKTCAITKISTMVGYHVVLVTLLLQLAANDQSEKSSCWHKNFVPKGLCAPAPGLYTCIKSWKKMYKVRLQRDFFLFVANDQRDKMFLLNSKFCPLGLSAPDLQQYTFIKSWKGFIKSEVEEILFKFATNDHSDEALLLTSKFWS